MTNIHKKFTPLEAANANRVLLLTGFTGVILAAGKGSRLADAGGGQPKALVKVAGHYLLEYSLDFLRSLSPREIIVVVGFEGDEVAALASKLAPEAKIACNQEFNKKGNLPSLLAAMALSENSFLVMNVDHLYRVSLRHLIFSGLGEKITVFCDFKQKFEPDERVILLDNHSFIKQIGKNLPQKHCGCVGLTYIPVSCRGTYLQAAATTAQKLGDAAGYEDVLQTLADMREKVAVHDVSGICPFEVDFPEELSLAAAGVSKNIAEFLKFN